MGSLNHIPALAIPEQQSSPLDQYGKMLSIQRLGTEQQIQQQTMKANDLDNQQRQLQVAQAQQDQKDQINFRAAFQQANGDPDQTVKLAAQAGVGPKLLVPFQQSILEHKTKLLTYNKDQQVFATSQADLQKGAWDTVDKAPEADKPQVYQQQLQGLQQMGVDVSKMPPQYDPQGFKLMGAVVSGHKQLLEDTFKQAEASKNKSQGDLAATENQVKQQQLTAAQQGGAVPGVPLENQEATAWLKKNPGKDLADYGKYKSTLVPAFNFNLQANGVNGGNAPKANPDGSQMSPEQMYQSFGAKSGVVKGIVEGRQTAPSGMAQKTPYWQDVMQKVYQVDPQWSEQRAQVRKAFTTGTDGRNIGNLNTASVHLDALGEISKALDNGTFQPGNALWNKAKTMFGAAAPTDYEGLRQAVAGEMDAALHGTSTIPGRNEIAATMPAKNAPGQMSGIIDTNLQTLQQKLNTYKERYEQQNPGDTAYSPVLPSAQKVFEKHGAGQQAGGKDFGPAPSGKADGATGKLQDGTKVVVKGGRLVAQ
jgi:hypothetical protein